MFASPPTHAQYPGGGGYPGSGPGYVPSGGGPNGPYSGGTLTLTNGHGVDAYPYYINGTDQPDFFGNSGGPLGAYGALYDTETPNGQTATATASGTIGYAFTWDGGPGNAPPPPAVIKTETCTVQYGYLSGAGSDGNPLAAAGADPPSPAGSAWACTKYSGINAPGATLTDSLAGAFASASATGPDGGAASAGVFDTVSYSPVTLQLVGPFTDGSGGQDILIGQGCTASIQGIPQALLPYTTYSWSVSGPTFQSWTVVSDPNNQSHTTETDGPGPLNVANPAWYWHEIGNNVGKPETVSCTVTVTPPAGQGGPFSISASQPVTVWVPNWDCTGTGGIMDVTFDGADYWLQAVPSLSGEDGGMDFRATVASPLPGLFLNGTIQLVQLTIPIRTITVGGLTYQNYYQNQEGLDQSYPYGWTAVPLGVTVPYYTRDSPRTQVTNADAATMQDWFTDYLMYKPSGSAQWVTVGYFVWSLDGNAAKPQSGGAYSWAYWSGTAGTVTPSGNAAPFSPSNSFPSWTQIIPTNDLWVPKP